MPSIAAKVLDLITGFGEVAFSTAQVLSCGNRNAVDIALCRLVKKRVITRLAAGIFVVNSDSGVLPSPGEIARAKASRFDKKLVEGRSGPQSAFCYFTDGCRSSFQTIYGRICFRHRSPSKRKSHHAHSEAVTNSQQLRPEKKIIGEHMSSGLNQVTLKLVDCLFELLFNLLGEIGSCSDRTLHQGTAGRSRLGRPL